MIINKSLILFNFHLNSIRKNSSFSKCMSYMLLLLWCKIYWYIKLLGSFTYLFSLYQVYISFQDIFWFFFYSFCIFSKVYKGWSIIRKVDQKFLIHFFVYFLLVFFTKYLRIFLAFTHFILFSCKLQNTIKKMIKIFSE